MGWKNAIRRISLLKFQKIVSLIFEYFTFSKCDISISSIRLLGSGNWSTNRWTSETRSKYVSCSEKDNVEVKRATSQIINKITNEIKHWTIVNKIS